MGTVGPMGDDTDLVLRTDRESVATLTLNRPAALNALSMAMLGALAEQLGVDHRGRLGPRGGRRGGRSRLQRRPRPARGGGPPDPDFRQRLFALLRRDGAALTRLRQPVIAQVAGVATAAGCQLVAMGSTWRWPGCQLASPRRVNIGLFCTTPMVAVSRTVAPNAMGCCSPGDLVDRAADRGW